METGINGPPLNDTVCKPTTSHHGIQGGGAVHQCPLRQADLKKPKGGKVVTCGIPWSTEMKSSRKYHRGDVRHAKAAGVSPRRSKGVQRPLVHPDALPGAEEKPNAISPLEANTRCPGLKVKLIRLQTIVGEGALSGGSSKLTHPQYHLMILLERRGLLNVAKL